ncbi:ribokinase [Actinobaculum suis]|uniref:Ribokinase n=1 Tax=Actinobaculum suis TaxID=1657 RepID=A0A1G7B1J6_9ACTO|nr:ribokinase [Actinobaculum suis]MDY5153507.1 ribokinase [Actinobaculum suis]SDE20136.1 ribokinase [Actinobaculum suis]
MPTSSSASSTPRSPQDHMPGAPQEFATNSATGATSAPSPSAPAPSVPAPSVPVQIPEQSLPTIREALRALLPADTDTRSQVAVTEPAGGRGSQVCVVGSANADLTIQTDRLPRPGETVHGSPLQILPGGKSANQAVQASRLGAPVAFVGALGSDPNGDLLRDSLTASGVDLTACAKLDAPTGCAVITVDSQAENTIVISPGTNAEVTAAFVEEQAAAITGAAVLGLCFEIPMEGTIAAAKIAREAGTTVFLNPSPFETVPAELLELTDVLVVNEGELASMLGWEQAADTANTAATAGAADPAATADTVAGANAADTKTRAAAAAGQTSAPAGALAASLGQIATSAQAREHVGKALAERGLHRVIVTLGSQGSVVFAGTATVVPAMRAAAVDTTGCGDSYFGSLLALHAAGVPLEQAALAASFISAVAATSLGAQASYATGMELHTLLQ